MGKSKNKCKCCVQVDQLRKELRQTKLALEEAEDKTSNYAKRLGDSQNMLQEIKRRNLRARNKISALRRYGPPHEAAFRREMDFLWSLLTTPASVSKPKAAETAKPITSSDPVDWDALTRQINEAWARTADELGREFRKFRDAYNKKGE